MSTLKYFDQSAQAWLPVGAGSGPTPVPGTGDLNYHHVQAMPSTQWTVNHNLGKYPSVSVVDSGGAGVLGEIRYVSMQQCILTFSAAFSGEAFFN